MRKSIFLAGALTLATATGSMAATIYLDGDTVATGSNLQYAPLVTSYGTITFDGEVSNAVDSDMAAAGGSGNNFDIFSSDNPAVTLGFSFAVDAISFVYGGNGGGITVSAFDEFGGIVDSFYQASTSSGQPAGPVTLSGTGIRSLSWNDVASGWAFAAIDNVTLTLPSVPLPAGGLLLVTGLGLLGAGAKRRKQA